MYTQNRTCQNNKASGQGQFPFILSLIMQSYFDIKYCILTCFKDCDSTSAIKKNILISLALRLQNQLLYGFLNLYLNQFPLSTKCVYSSFDRGLKLIQQKPINKHA